MRWLAVLSGVLLVGVLVVAGALQWGRVVLPVPAPVGVEAPPPTAPATVFVNWKAAPRSLPENFRLADLVVLVHRDSDRVRTIQEPGRSACTLCAFRLLEVFKGDVRKGDSIEVRWEGRPTQVVEGFPRPAAGETVVFFLRVSARGIEPMYGPGTTFRMVDGKIDNARWPEFHARPTEVLLSELRRLAGK